MGNSNRMVFANSTEMYYAIMSTPSGDVCLERGKRTWIQDMVKHAGNGMLANPDENDWALVGSIEPKPAGAADGHACEFEGYTNHTDAYLGVKTPGPGEWRQWVYTK